MFYFSEKYEKGRVEDEYFEIEDIEEETEKNIYSSESTSNKIRTRSNENIFFLNLYKDGMYIITNKQLFENNIIKSISINPNIDKFILQCYHMEVSIKCLSEYCKKKRGKENTSMDAIHKTA